MDIIEIVKRPSPATVPGKEASAVSPAVGEPVVEGVGKLGELLPQLVVLLLPHFLLKLIKQKIIKAQKTLKS